MSLREKAMEMRNAIDGIDLALHGNIDLPKQRALFSDARDDLKIKVTITVADLRQLGRAMDECNRIANSPEYTPAQLDS